MIEVQEDNFKMQSSCSIQSNEKSQTSLMELIATIANFQKLQCLLCKRKFTSMANLRRHMAIHIGWNRFRCKLCDFKCFFKCDCVAHCNKIHNTQNNRAVIAELIFEIPPNEYTYNENIFVDVTNTREKMNNPDVMDVTASLESETYVDLNNLNTNVVVQNEATTTNEQQESSKNMQDIADENEDKTAIVQNLAEYMMNSGSGKLDAHPDLKRVVMEVIFGSSNTNATTAQTESDKPVSKANNNVRKFINDNENSTASIETKKGKEVSCSVSEVSSTLDDNLKHQRPIRNRMKPLNDDFVYDLKEIAFRKECTLFNDSGTLHVRKKAKLYN